jgi:riboflavin kinase / FMN adenylyltransferase
MALPVLTHLPPEGLNSPLNSVVALGMFDGLHRGHQAVLSQALTIASTLANTQPVVFSFATHPKTLLQHQRNTFVPEGLTTLNERLFWFEAMGFALAYTPPFTQALQQLTCEAFVATILKQGLKATHVVVGYDFRFGQDRLGSAQWLLTHAERLGLTVTVVPPLYDEHTSEPYSSTAIREGIRAGNLAKATAYLGRPYSLLGQVVTGHGRGSAQLGFATANLALSPPNRVLPPAGVYAGYAWLKGQWYKAVANLGNSPTFTPATTLTPEVHLIGYHGEAFYGEVVVFALLHRLRPEQAFATVEALCQQIKADIAQAEALLPKAEQAEGLTLIPTPDGFSPQWPNIPSDKALNPARADANAITVGY